MERNRSLIALALLVACGKSDPKPDPKPDKKPDEPVKTDAACAAKVKELGPWLEQLELERGSHEIDFGYSLQVIDRAAFPISHRIDAVEIKEKEIEAFDTSERDHASGTLDAKPTEKALEEKLAQMFAAKPDPTDTLLAPGDVVRIDVDPKAQWGDVVRVVDAATKAGYPRAIFAFTATSKLVAPLGVAAKVTDADEISKASKRLEEMREKQCDSWNQATRHHKWNPDKAADVKASAKETADGIAACNCAADPDEVRVLMWKDAHWHQAIIRVPINVRLGGGPAIQIPIAGKTPWSEAHAQLVAAAPEGAPPPVLELVAK